MRVALVVQGLPPFAASGVEAHSAALARALVAEGAVVEALSLRRLPGLAPLAQRREEREGWAVTWINVDPAAPPSEVERADAFTAFLERERPDVVHFEAVRDLGLEAVLALDGLCLPAVYSAHDWFAVSDQTLLLDPSGSPFEPGGRDREAAMAVDLQRLHEAGLDPQAEFALSEEGFEHPAAETHSPPQAWRRRLERKKAAFSLFSARFAASKSTARRLSATLGRAVDWRAPGIDAQSFEGARFRRRGGSVRLGYIGPLGRASGVHLLLEALGELEVEGVETVIHGDTDEREHLRTLRRRARELGVTWGGPYRVEDLPALLESIDVRVIPALWDGGGLFEALEARAARRPVLAARHATLEEVVRDDVDGLFFEPGDAHGLGEAVQRFTREEFLLDRFELELRPPRTVQSEAREWLETYRELVQAAESRRAVPDCPGYLQPFVERYEHFSRLSTRDLLGQVLAGLEVLGEQMGLRATPRELLIMAAGRGSGLRDAAAADRRLIERLQRKIERADAARSELVQRTEAHASRLEELRGRLEEREEALVTLEKEVSEARRARDELAGQREVDAQERSRLEEQLEQRLAAARELSGELERERAAYSQLREERDHLQATLEAGARELRYLRERFSGGDDDGALADHEAIELHFESLEKELRGLREHESWLRRELGGLLEVVAEKGGHSGSLPLSPAGVEASREGIERLAKELEWRRKEMSAAREASSSLFARLAGGSLIQRVRSWQAGGEA